MKMNNKPLNIKIGFYFLITNLVLVLLLGSIFYFSSSSLLIQKEISAKTEAIEKSGNYIELYMSKLTTLSQVISHDKGVYDYLKNKDETDITPTPSQELPLVSEMKGQLVEVALTFDRPYTYSELQSMLPSNLKVNWYWLGTYSNYNTENLNISNIFGFKLTKDDAEYSFDIFKTHLKNSLKDKHGLTSITTSKGEVYNTKKELEYLNKTFKNLEDCTFSGVILTGKAENFAQLEEKEWIYASSIGASVPNQPYYKLDKE